MLNPLNQISNGEVLELRRGVLRAPGEELAHERVLDGLWIEAVVGRRHAGRFEVGGELLRCMQEFDEIGRDRFLVVTRP